MDGIDLEMLQQSTTLHASPVSEVVRSLSAAADADGNIRFDAFQQIARTFFAPGTGDAVNHIMLKAQICLHPTDC